MPGAASMLLDAEDGPKQTDSNRLGKKLDSNSNR